MHKNEQKQGQTLKTWTEKTGTDLEGKVHENERKTGTDLDFKQIFLSFLA